MDERTYTFGELSERAKRVALDKHQEQLGYEWWDTTYEDVQVVGGLLGIEIGMKPERSASRPPESRDIQFSGFSSQGDGCCWTGVLWVENFASAPAKIAQDYPNDTELEILARHANEIFEMVTAVHVAKRLNPPDPESDDPQYADCYPTVKISVKGESHRGFSTNINSSHYDLPVEVEDALNTYAQDFADWVYSQLEAEYEHLTSDESTQAYIEGEEMLFDELGNDI